VYYLYILQSETTGRFYVGQAHEVPESLAYHNANYSKSLKNRGPWRLVYTEQPSRLLPPCIRPVFSCSGDIAKR